ELMDIRYYFKKLSKKVPGLTVHVHLQDRTSRKLFLDLEDSTQADTEPFHVKLINLYELFVDALFKRHPIYTTKQKGAPVHLLIIGFGPLGQHIALKAINQSKRFGKESPFITAVDKAMPQVQQQWERDYGQLTEQVSISLHSFDVTLEPIETVIHNQSQPITHIYVCLHEDHLDLWAGIEL